MGWLGPRLSRPQRAPRDAAPPVAVPIRTAVRVVGGPPSSRRRCSEQSSLVLRTVVGGAPSSRRRCSETAGSPGGHGLTGSRDTLPLPPPAGPAPAPNKAPSGWDDPAGAVRVPTLGSKRHCSGGGGAARALQARHGAAPASASAGQVEGDALQTPRPPLPWGPPSRRTPPPRPVRVTSASQAASTPSPSPRENSSVDPPRGIGRDRRRPQAPSGPDVRVGIFRVRHPSLASADARARATVPGRRVRPGPRSRDRAPPPRPRPRTRPDSPAASGDSISIL